VLSRVVRGDVVASSCNDSASSKSVALGGGDRVVFSPEDGDTCIEWQAGVLSAESPAVRAM
jgi:hypothetical protein